MGQQGKNAEMIVKNALNSLGWSASGVGGWPDFLCYREREGKIELAAVEVKSANDQIRSNQRKILKLLANVMKVYVVRDPGGDQEFEIERIEASNGR